MTRTLLLLAIGSLSLSINAFAQDANTASGTLIIGKHNVAIKHVYLVSAMQGDKKGRRLIFSAKDIAASIGKCTKISCATNDLNEGLELELDSGERLNLWAVANGQKVQHSDTAVRSTFTATADKPDEVAGVLAIDRSNIGGPKINIEFKARLTQSFKE